MKVKPTSRNLITTGSILITMIGVIRCWTMSEIRTAMHEWASSDDVDDPTDALHSWRDSSINSVCDFDGVDCYHYYDTYWISDLNLEGLDLAGTIPPWLWSCVKDSINLSNNQWYNTTEFYQDITSPGTEDFMTSLNLLNCSNCGFFLKVESGEFVLPEEWSKFESLTVFDFSNNTHLIGQLPSAWVDGWDKIVQIDIRGTGICEPLPFIRTAELHINGDAFTADQCPELPPYYPWEPPPPPTEPPSTTDVYLPEIEPTIEDEIYTEPIPTPSAIDDYSDVEYIHSIEAIRSMVELIEYDHSIEAIRSMEDLIEYVDDDQTPISTPQFPTDDSYLDSPEFDPSPDTSINDEEWRPTSSIDPSTADIEPDSDIDKIEHVPESITEAPTDQIEHVPEPSTETPIDEVQSAEVDCRIPYPIGRLSMPEIVNFTPVEIELDQIEDEDLCTPYSCEIQLDGIGDSEVESTMIDGRHIWSVSPPDDGDYSVTLTISDNSISNCNISLSSDFTLDRKSPNCHVTTVSSMNASTYIGEAVCDEEIFQIDRESIEISNNGKLLEVFVERRAIHVLVEVTNYKSETIDVVLSKSSYRDRAGNEGVSELHFTITIESSLLFEDFAIALTDAPIEGVIAGTVVVSTAVSSGTVFLSGGSSSGLNFKSNIIRASFHLQFLSFTANLAVPRLSSTYVKLAKKFSWTTLASSGDEPWATVSSENDDFTNDRKRSLLDTQNDGTEEWSESQRRREGLIKTLIGCALFTAACVVSRTLLEAVLKFGCRNLTRPKLLTVPRLELQALAIMMPPLTYASMRLIAVGSPDAIQAGLCCVILLVLPYTLWILCHLTIRSLILKPEIFYEQEASILETSDLKKRKEVNLLSTVSGELIGVPTSNECGLVPYIVPPHEEGINDFVRDVEQPLSGRRGSTPRSTTPLERHLPSPSPPSLQLRGVKIQPTTSENETKTLLHQNRHSTASVSSIEFHPDPIAPPESGHSSEEHVLDGRPWILKERNPRKHFIAKYGFAFEDVLGPDAQVGRTRLKGRYLITYSLFFIHKLLAAMVFGCSTSGEKDWIQVGILCAMHLILVGHLLIVRPYATRALYWIELIVNSLQTTILMGALFLLIENYVQIANSVMIGAFLSAVLVLGIYELRHLVVPLRRIVKFCKR